MTRNASLCYVVAASVGSGVAVLEATPGSNVSQVGLTAVSLSVTASGGAGTLSYSWALYAPDGTDQTVLLSDNEITNPTFTPTLQSGQWVAVCTVSDTAGASVTAVQTVVIGDKNYIEVFRHVFDGTTNTAPSAGTLVISGKTWTVVNTDADSGPKLLNGRIAVTPGPSTTVGSGGVSAPGLRIALSDLHASLSSMVGKELLVCLEFDSYSPAASDEGFSVGLQAAGSGFGAGSGSRAYAAGQGRSSSIRAGRTLGQNSGVFSSTYSNATTASVNSFASRLSNLGVQIYSSATPEACNTPTKVAALSPVMDGGAIGGVSFTDRAQLELLFFKPTTGANGAQGRVSAIYVLVRP